MLRETFARSCPRSPGHVGASPRSPSWPPLTSGRRIDRPLWGIGTRLLCLSSPGSRRGTGIGGGIANCRPRTSIRPMVFSSKSSGWEWPNQVLPWLERRHRRTTSGQRSSPCVIRTDSYSCIWIQRTRCAFHEGCFRHVNKRMVLWLPSKSMACHAANNRLQRTVMDRVPSDQSQCAAADRRRWAVQEWNSMSTVVLSLR